MIYLGKILVLLYVVGIAVAHITIHNRNSVAIATHKAIIATFGRNGRCRLGWYKFGRIWFCIQWFYLIPIYFIFRNRK